MLGKPKQVPESASEALGGARKPEAPARIVERPLPEEKPTAPKLPFSPDELRAAIAQQTQAPVVAPQKQAVPAKPVFESHDLRYEIDEFESALQDAHTTVAPSTRAIAPVRQAKDLPDQLEGSPGFFDEYGQSLLQNGIEEEGDRRDVIRHMREFYRHQQQGKEYYLHAADVKAAVERRLRELKTLEREWSQARREIDELERGLTGIEREIEGKTDDLRQLIHQSKSRSRIERPVPEGREFLLADGRKLASLLDLRIALRTMTDEVYRRHVQPGRNDFAAWVRDSVGDADLAKELERSLDRYQLEIALSRIPQ